MVGDAQIVATNPARITVHLTPHMSFLQQFINPSPGSSTAAVCPSFLRSLLPLLSFKSSATSQLCSSEPGLSTIKDQKQKSLLSGCFILFSSSPSPHLFINSLCKKLSSTLYTHQMFRMSISVSAPCVLRRLLSSSSSNVSFACETASLLLILFVSLAADKSLRCLFVREIRRLNP